MPRLHKPLLTGLIAVAVALVAGASARAQSEPVPHEIESAVDRGLAWLARQQAKNGSWNANAAGHDAAITGLAGMAFMARGHVPGQGPYGDNLNRAVDFIISVQRSDGLFSESAHESMYDHGICTIMLCEAYGMLDDARQERARPIISRALKVILDAQNVPKSNANDQGGWRYQAHSVDSDLSVSGWQLMALRAAANAGADVPKGAIDDAIKYIKHCATPNGGFFYTSASLGTSHALTGTGILSLILLGDTKDAKSQDIIKRGGDYLLKERGLFESPHYYYTQYYCAQAAWQLGGAYWTQINADISTDLRRKQQRDGSWPAPTDADGQGGSHYATAMAILSLTVPYRYLPLYQR